MVFILSILVIGFKMITGSTVYDGQKRVKYIYLDGNPFHEKVGCLYIKNKYYVDKDSLGEIIGNENIDAAAYIIDIKIKPIEAIESIYNKIILFIFKDVYQKVYLLSEDKNLKYLHISVSQMVIYTKI